MAKIVSRAAPEMLVPCAMTADPGADADWASGCHSPARKYPASGKPAVDAHRRRNGCEPGRRVHDCRVLRRERPDDWAIRAALVVPLHDTAATIPGSAGSRKTGDECGGGQEAGAVGARAHVPTTCGEERLQSCARSCPARPASGVEDEIVAIERIGAVGVLSWLGASCDRVGSESQGCGATKYPGSPMQ